MKNYLVEAIKYLNPTAEFVITNDDYSTIVWHQLDGDAPTEKQIDDAIKTIEAAKAAEAEAKAQAKAELLERLNITADEAKLLLS